LIRTSALRETPLHGSYARGDSVLLARLALMGRFIELPQRLFLSRSHTSQSMQTLPSSAMNGHGLLRRLLGTGPLPPPEWWDASRKGKANFPEWNLFKEYWLSIAQSGLDQADRARCRRVMARWLIQNLHKLSRDVIFAAENLLSRITQRLSSASRAVPHRASGPAPRPATAQARS
jgi:hypothetical protein